MIPGMWDQFLDILKEEAGSRVVETWFKAVSLQRWDPMERRAYLEAPNNFVKEWIVGNYMHLVRLHLGRLLNVEALDVVLLDASKKKDT